MVSRDVLNRRNEKLDETAPQRDNPFKEITLEQAKADKAMWDAFKITTEDGMLKIECSLISEIHLPSAVLDDVKGDKAGQIAKGWRQRIELDVQEFEMFLMYRLAEHFNAQ